MLIPKTEITPIADRYLETMRGLDQFSRDNFDVEIIDHDFAPEHESLESPSGSLEGFARHIDHIIDEIPENEQDGQAMRRNLQSTRLALDVLSGKVKIGEDIDYLDYIEQTMGVRPKMTPETAKDGPDSLEEQRQSIEKLVEGLGYSYTPQDRDAFNSAFAIHPDAMQSTVESMVAPSKEHLASLVGSALLKGLDNIDVEVIQHPSMWQAYFGTTERRKFIAQFNANPVLTFSALEEHEAVVHELAHGVSSTHKQELIDEGKLSPAMGILPVFSPAYFQDEVGARAAEESLLAKDLSPFAEYVLKATKYKVDVNTNMMIMANSGSSVEEVAEYGISHMPFDNPDKFKTDANDYAENLVYRTVFAVDSEAVRAGRRIAALPEDERRASLIKLFSGPVETSELLAA